MIDTTTPTGEAKADAAERLHEATRQVRLAQAHEQAAIEAFDAASTKHWKTVEHPAWLATRNA